MTDFAKEVISANIEDELRKSYLDYAMSVIVGRAISHLCSFNFRTDGGTTLKDSGV